VDCDFFTTNIFEVKSNQKRDYSNLDSFVIFMCVEGTTKVGIGNKTEIVAMGETILIPANTDAVTFNSEGSKLLEVFI